MFTSLTLKGKIRTVVRLVTLQGMEGILLSGDTNIKSGQLVIDVLWKKHLAPIIPAVEVLKCYNVVPEFVLLDVTKDSVEIISGRLTGTASPGGITAAGL